MKEDKINKRMEFEWAKTRFIIVEISSICDMFLLFLLWIYNFHIMFWIILVISIIVCISTTLKIQKSLKRLGIIWT